MWRGKTERRYLPTLPLALANLGPLPHLRIRKRDGDRATVKKKKKTEIMCSSLPAAPLNGFFQQSRAGAIIQLPACTRAKPGRLVHLHKRQPRMAHMQTHTHTHRQELVGLRERERLCKDWPPLVRGTRQKSDPSPAVLVERLPRWNAGRPASPLEMSLFRSVYLEGINTLASGHLSLFRTYTYQAPGEEGAAP